MILQIQKYLAKERQFTIAKWSLNFRSSSYSCHQCHSWIYQQFKEIMVIFNGSNYEQSLLHILENMVPEAVSDAEMILQTMICCRGIMRWDCRRRLTVSGYTPPGTDLAELLEYEVLPYYKNIPKP